MLAKGIEQNGVIVEDAVLGDNFQQIDSLEDGAQVEMEEFGVEVSKSFAYEKC